MKNLINGFNSRLDTEEEMVSKFFLKYPDWSTDTKIKNGKYRKSIRSIWKFLKLASMCNWSARKRGEMVLGRNSIWKDAAW